MTINAIAAIKSALSRVELSTTLSAPRRLVLFGALANGLPNHHKDLLEIYLEFRENHHNDRKSQADYVKEFEAYANTGKAHFNSIFKILKNELKVELTQSEKDALSKVGQSAGERAYKTAKTPLDQYHADLLDLNDPENSRDYTIQISLPPRNDDPSFKNYFVSKGLTTVAGAAYESGDKTIVPLMDLITQDNHKGQIYNLQKIWLDGKKKRCIDGEPQKGVVYFVPDRVTVYAAATVGICEGVATAESVFLATGIPQIAAINSCNISLSAISLIEFGTAEKIFLVTDTDADAVKKAKITVSACRAGISAKGSNCRIDYVLPALEGSNKDFNDLMQLQGVEPVREAIFSALTTLETHTPQETYPLTELGNGKRLADFIRNRIRFTSSLNLWLEYDGRRWVPIQRKPLTEAKDLIELMRIESTSNSDLAKWQQKTETAKGVDAMIKLSVAYDLETDFMQFDSNQYQLNCENGLLDLNTFELQPHNPNQQVSKIANVNFDESARMDLWLKFVSEFTCDDVEQARYLQKLLGLCLTGNVSEQLMHIFHGGGENGKSLLLDVLLSILGDYATTINHDFFLTAAKDTTLEKMSLRGVRVALANELPERCVLSENFIKEIIGNGVIKARAHFKDFITFPETFKLLVSTNHKPKVFGTDNGIWRRLRLIPCELTLAPDKKDRNLKEKLLSERDGILLWCLEGLKMWRDEGLTPTERMKHEHQIYRDSEDTIGEFLNDCTISSDEFSVNTALLYETYVDWCKWNGEKHWTKNTFTKKLCERKSVVSGNKYEIKRVRLPHERNLFQKVYAGLTLRAGFSLNTNFGESRFS